MKIEWEIYYYDGPIEFIASETIRKNDISTSKVWHCVLENQDDNADWEYLCFSPVWDTESDGWCTETRKIKESDLKRATISRPHVSIPDTQIETQELNVRD